MKLTNKILQHYVDAGLVIAERHPSLPLTLYKYTKFAQYRDIWDYILLSCRGIVLDDDDNIVSRPYRKFFNHFQDRHIPTDKFTVYEKYDGYLIILFNYKGQWICTSSGSFTSDYVKFANNNFFEKIDLSLLDDKFTYIFELIHPKYKIVVQYDNIDLILHGKINTSNGIMDFNTDKYSNLFTLAKKYEFKSLEEVYSQEYENFEGFIIVFENGDMCKYKMTKYCNIHKHILHLSNKSIYDCLKSGMSEREIIESYVEDEFYDFIKEHIFNFKLNYFRIKSFIYDEYYDIIKELGYNYTKKDLADKVKNRISIKGFEHMIYFIDSNDENNLNDAIWKKLKPKETIRAYFNYIKLDK